MKALPAAETTPSPTLDLETYNDARIVALPYNAFLGWVNRFTKGKAAA